MKLISWNVNGIRSVAGKGFGAWFDAQEADVVCLQEIKARPEQLPKELWHPGRNTAIWNPAQKPGYSGVALFSRKEPLEVTLGLGVPELDTEGRTIVAEFPSFVLINAYFPNSQRDHARLDYKLAFCERMREVCDAQVKKGKNVIVCGDFNIAHREIDLANPKTNKDNAGFLPEERAWMDSILSAGYLDAFRAFCDEPGHYTWWSQRSGVRERNIGWRLDSFVTNGGLRDRLKGVTHQTQVRGSDHCPVVLELKG